MSRVSELSLILEETAILLQEGEWEEAMEGFSRVDFVEEMSALSRDNLSPSQTKKIQITLEACITEAERLKAEAAAEFQSNLKFQTTLQDASDSASPEEYHGQFIDSHS
jgi:hypothetical protein